MTEKCERFLNELIQLCQRHNVVLSVSGYDAIQVWDDDGASEYIHSNGIEDKTKLSGS